MNQHVNIPRARAFHFSALPDLDIHDYAQFLGSLCPTRRERETRRMIIALKDRFGDPLDSRATKS